jgi:hypothetical protein
MSRAKPVPDLYHRGHRGTPRKTNQKSQKPTRKPKTNKKAKNQQENRKPTGKPKTNRNTENL